MKKILNDKFIGKLFKTFIEGFLASLIIMLQDIYNFKSEHIIKTTLIGGIAMGISAVLNVIQKRIGGDDNG